MPFLAVIVLLCAAGQAPEPARLATAIKAADQILTQQTSDGAIVMSKIGAGQSSVVSYFSCFAAQGLLAVYAAKPDPRYLDGAQKWVAWYEAHQNADGTIYDYKGGAGAWESTGHFDSTDSYAAVYLDLLKDAFRASADKKWLAKRKGAILRALKGIRLTMQSSGLTLAKPDYAVMYTMDNVETLLGLRAAAGLLSALGDTAEKDRAQSQADAVEASIGAQLWNEPAGCYRVGIQPDCGKMEGLKRWFPDVMANLMAVAWLPFSSRNAALYRKLVSDFGGGPSAIRTVDDLEHAVWWAWAALGARDRAEFLRLSGVMGSFESVCAGGCEPGLLGHVARLCSAR